MSAELLTRGPELVKVDLVEQVGFMALEEIVDLDDSLVAMPTAGSFQSSLSTTFTSSLA